MPTRGPVPRLLLGLGAPCAGAVVLVGGVALRGSGLVAVVLAGAVAACLAAGVARESTVSLRRAPLELAWQTFAWAVGVLLGIAGTAALGGPTVAAAVTGAGAMTALAVWLMRSRRPAGAAPGDDLTDVPGWPTAALAGPALPPPPVRPVSPPSAGRTDTVPTGGARLLPPVSALTTRALGREWLLSTSALAGRLEPSTRESIVRRREDALTELERRDPVGFSRWLAEGPRPGSDPADYLRPEAA